MVRVPYESFEFPNQTGWLTLTQLWMSCIPSAYDITQPSANSISTPTLTPPLTVTHTILLTLGELHWVDAPLLADVDIKGQRGMDTVTLT